MQNCEHRFITSTFELGVHCSTCKEPLVGFFWPVSRNTLAGKLLYSMYKDTDQKEQEKLDDFIKHG